MEVLKQLQTQVTSPNSIQEIGEMQGLIKASIQEQQQQQQGAESEAVEIGGSGGQQGQGQQEKKALESLTYYLNLFRASADNPGMRNKFLWYRSGIQKLQPVLLQPPEDQVTAQERYDFMQVRCDGVYGWCGGVWGISGWAGGSVRGVGR